MEAIKCGDGEDVQARYFDVSIPGVNADGLRTPWCPRVLTASKDEVETRLKVRAGSGVEC